MNIARNLERTRLFFPDKPALIFEGQTYTYRQIDEDVNRLASGKDMPIKVLMSRGESHFKTIEADRHDPAAILYTSGTTGFPKGATLTQSNINSNAYSTVHHVGIRSDDRLHLFLPLFHCFGQNFILNSGICAGAAFVMHRRFEPEPVAEAIRRDKVTMFIAVPTIFTYFLNMNLPAKDLSGLRYCFTGHRTRSEEKRFMPRLC